MPIIDLGHVIVAVLAFVALYLQSRQQTAERLALRDDRDRALDWSTKKSEERYNLLAQRSDVKDQALWALMNGKASEMPRAPAPIEQPGGGFGEPPQPLLPPEVAERLRDLQADGYSEKDALMQLAREDQEAQQS